MNTEFTNIINGVDSRMTIVMHKQSGFYNATKSVAMIDNVKKAEIERLYAEITETQEGVAEFRHTPNQASGDNMGGGRIPPPPKKTSEGGKRVKNWLTNKDARAKVGECARMNNITIEECKFVFDDGNGETSGTYIHPDLYDHFLSWVDPVYAMRVSAVLKQFHADANSKIIKEKDDALEAFREEMRLSREEARQERERDRMLQQQILDQLSIAKADHMITHMKLNRADTKSDMYHFFMISRDI